MLLKLQAKTIAERIGQLLGRALGTALCLATAACISSTGPILSEANSILGERGQLHVFEIVEGAAHSPRRYAFQWNGKSYVVANRQAEISAFTVHVYEGRDLIVQARARRPLRPYVYALARKVTDGVYRLTTIDPSDADEATRDRFCIKTRDAPCRIETPEQLFVFARATAAREEAGGGKLVVLVRDKKR
jgi:hypothetical protein